MAVVAERERLGRDDRTGRCIQIADRLRDFVVAERVSDALGGLASGVLDRLQDRLLVAGEVRVVDQVLDRTGPLASGERAVKVRVVPVNRDRTDTLRRVTVVDSRASSDDATAVAGRRDDTFELGRLIRATHKWHCTPSSKAYSAIRGWHVNFLTTTGLGSKTKSRHPVPAYPIQRLDRGANRLPLGSFADLFPRGIPLLFYALSRWQTKCMYLSFDGNSRQTSTEKGPPGSRWFPQRVQERRENS